MRSRCPRDAGTVTAEFAVALPAAVLATAAMLGGIAVGGAHVRAIDGAATAARSLARGDSRVTADGLVAATRAGRIDGVEHRSDGLVCVTVRNVLPVFGTAITLPISADGCALEPAEPAEPAG